MMSEANKELVRRHFEELFNRSNLAAADELMAEDYIEYGVTPFGQAEPGRVNGPIAMRRTVQWLLAQYPDLHMTIEAIVAEGDTVAVRMFTEGTQPRAAQRGGAAHWQAVRSPPDPLVPDPGRQAGRALGDPGGPADGAEFELLMRSGPWPR
jgi:ketosteroid isomerase-like protein